MSTPAHPLGSRAKNVNSYVKRAEAKSLLPGPQHSKAKKASKCNEIFVS